MKVSNILCAVLGLVLVIGNGCSTMRQKSTVSIEPSRIEIVIPENADQIKLFAAEELQKHLNLITGVTPDIQTETKQKPGKYPIYVGIKPTGDKTPLKPEEARWQVTPEAIYIYGADLIRYNHKNKKNVIFQQKLNQTGTLFAVYDFLENELGVRWIEPGDAGIVYRTQTPLSLTIKQHSWNPKFVQRQIRTGLNKKYLTRAENSSPVGFELTKKQKEQFYNDVQLWLKRMRMGRSLVLNYGHAFTKWWDKYGRTNPDFFALTKEGKRVPYAHKRDADRVKMCVSNPKLHDQVITEWLKLKNKEDWRSETINVCENDSAGYCLCEKCVALDMPKSDEEFPCHLTDRYVYFANKIVDKAKRHDPKAKAVMYAYSYYKYPPRHEKVNDGVVIGFVPALLTPDKELQKMYMDWQGAGANELFLRPNDFHIDTGLPMGFEKKLFDNFKIGYDKGIIGTDYDCLHNFWRTSGIANYILAKAHIDPDKSFEYWEDEYCGSFGPAKNDVKEYFRYWRSLWDKRFVPNKKKIIEKGRYGNFRRGLMWDLYKYYNDADFDKTDQYLNAALAKNLTAQQKMRVDNLVKANKHARLMYAAMKAKYDPASKNDTLKLLECNRKLLSFRKANKNDLNLNLPQHFKIEKTYGDVCGTSWSELFKGMKPVKPLATYWLFKMDPQSIGLKEKWQDSSWSSIKTSWERIRTGLFWEKQPKNISEKLRNQLKNYDGIGWYATRLKIPEEAKEKELYLTFGAVDESCWVYVDGKEVGKHIFTKSDDWKTPFAIKINSALTDKNTYTVIVRVEDKAGAGGIWRPVWLAVK